MKEVKGKRKKKHNYVNSGRCNACLGLAKVVENICAKSTVTSVVVS